MVFADITLEKHEVANEKGCSSSSSSGSNCNNHCCSSSSHDDSYNYVILGKSIPLRKLYLETFYSFSRTSRAGLYFLSRAFVKVSTFCLGRV